MWKCYVCSFLAACWGPHYLSITTFPQDPQQLKAFWLDVFRPLIDVVFWYLDLLTVIHVAAHTTLSTLFPCLFYTDLKVKNRFTGEYAEYLQLKATALLHDVIKLSLEQSKWSHYRKALYSDHLLWSPFNLIKLRRHGSIFALQCKMSFY